MDFFFVAVSFHEVLLEGFRPAAWDGLVEGFGAGVPADEVAVVRVGGVFRVGVGFAAGLATSTFFWGKSKFAKKTMRKFISPVCDIVFGWRPFSGR